MCYVLFLSTTSAGNLLERNSDLIRFSRDLSGRGEIPNLGYPNRWYIGSKSECSCTFRHLHDHQLGFEEPVDWFPEDADEIDATVQVIRIIRELVVQGHAVDCFDAWRESDQLPASTGELEVDLGKVKNLEFRFFENYYFSFVASREG